jgi:microsomal prostaglandin-E synthase 2
MHTETKWSLYDRVPIVVIENERIQLNDSSLIISAIESYLRQPTKTFKNIIKLYQSIVEKDQKGKLSFTYPNRYAIVESSNNDRLEIVKDQEKFKVNNQSKSFFAKLFSRSSSQTELIENQPIIRKRSNEENEFERQWREWVDNKFIHVISPNIYCTLRQSLNTFRWFSKAGDWEEIFPWYQRWIIVYLGAIVMRLVAIRLKKKYNLNDNVRVSLYECGEEWANAIGEKDFLGKIDFREGLNSNIISFFLGGSEPNLADLNVYGILTAMQGCEAFKDLMINTKIQPWFERMKNLIEPHRIDTPVRSIS